MRQRGGAARPIQEVIAAMTDQEPKPNSPEDVGFLDQEQRPTGHVPKQCSSCHAPIVWAQLIDEFGDRVVHEGTLRPKSIPVDFEPVANGNVQLFDRHGAIVGRVLGKVDADAARAKGARLRLSHFATCKFAAKHRRKRG